MRKWINQNSLYQRWINLRLFLSKNPWLERIAAQQEELHLLKKDVLTLKRDMLNLLKENDSMKEKIEELDLIVQKSLGLKHLAMFSQAPTALSQEETFAD